MGWQWNINKETRNEEDDAKTCKVSIDEWMSMTVEQQKAKKAEVRAARKAAKTAK